MTPSKKAKSEDAKFIRRFKNLRPKARFKELSKADQYAVTARTLSVRLEALRDAIGGQVGKLASGKRFTLRSISDRYVIRDPATNLLTLMSIRKIKRAVSNVFKSELGKDAQFMFVIEQQSKDGSICDPHIHAIAILPFTFGGLASLRVGLHKIVGDYSPDAVVVQNIAPYGKGWNELSPSDANFRRSAQYDTKNDHSVCYRSKSLQIYVHEHFEALRNHHGTK